MTAIRYAMPDEVKPRVFKDIDAIIWPWVAEVPFVPVGSVQWRVERPVIDRSVHASWREAIQAALTYFAGYRPAQPPSAGPARAASTVELGERSQPTKDETGGEK